jgi:hypothetical protein
MSALKNSEVTFVVSVSWNNNSQSLANAELIELLVFSF